MKHPSSVLIFQPGLGFPTPGAIRDFFLSFQELTFLALFRHKLDIWKKSVLKTSKSIFWNGPGSWKFEPGLENQYRKWWFHQNLADLVFGASGTLEKNLRKRPIQKVAPVTCYMGSLGSLGGIHGSLGGTDGTLGPMGPWDRWDLGLKDPRYFLRDTSSEFFYRYPARPGPVRSSWRLPGQSFLSENKN